MYMARESKAFIAQTVEHCICNAKGGSSILPGGK